MDKLDSVDPNELISFTADCAQIQLSRISAKMGVP
jgi:hypothetical protein